MGPARTPVATGHLSRDAALPSQSCTYKGDDPFHTVVFLSVSASVSESVSVSESESESESASASASARVRLFHLPYMKLLQFSQAGNGSGKNRRQTNKYASSLFTV